MREAEPDRSDELEEPQLLSPPQELAPPAPAELGPGTVFTGELLRSVKEKRGVTLQEIAETTRIGVRTLRAIEEERFEELPNARVYIRGFVRCYAQEVGLDPDLVAKSYLDRWASWAESERSSKHRGLGKPGRPGGEGRA